MPKMPQTVAVWLSQSKPKAQPISNVLGTHLQMGIGDGLIPNILDTNIYDNISIVRFDECPKLVDSLKARKPVIINLEKVESDTARKIFDSPR